MAPLILKPALEGQSGPDHFTPQKSTPVPVGGPQGLSEPFGEGKITCAKLGFEPRIILPLA
jgi:hypothetical protein